VIVVVLAAAPLVQKVPLAVTAAILIVAAISMIRPRAFREIWDADRSSAAVMAGTFVLVLAVPLQYAVLAGAAVSVLKYVYASSRDLRVVRVSVDASGRARETATPSALADGSVTLLDVYGSLFFGAGPRLRESLPAVGEARCAVVVLRLRGRAALPSATIALLRQYAGELAAGGGRLYLAGVGPETGAQLRRTGLAAVLGDDAVLAATDELYGSCAAAQRRGQAWVSAHGQAPSTRPDATEPLPNGPEPRPNTPESRPDR
jgi:sulfate permease, SulP family